MHDVSFLIYYMYTKIYVYVIVRTCNTLMDFE